MLSIKYPISIVSNKDRYAFLYRLEELLRLEHNAVGTKFREKKITEQQWREYKNNIFELKSQLISDEICQYRKLAGLEQFFNPKSQSISDEITEYKKQARKNKESIAKLSDIVI